MSIYDKQIKAIAELLKKMNWQLVTAESCTGGLIAGYLTEIPGSSAWFERGFVTYSNLAKEELLAIPKTLLEEYGAVSEPVALAMATGALAHSAGQIALSVTGIAGPDGGSVEKPVGTVCFAFAADNMNPLTLKKQFSGNRQEIRLAATEEALSGILAYLGF
jgi:nicotinamide-nucleotide amidase